MPAPLEITIHPAPNPALSERLRSDDMRAIVRDVTYLAEALYREEVAKDTSRLAAATHVGTEIGGTYSDRWIGVLTVGRGVEYVLPHEFGAAERFDENRGDPAFDETMGARDLNRVLEILSVAMYL